MGVYNPWAEMPRSCVACDFRYSCPLSSPTAHGIFGFVHPDCPLVEVSVPHGRLGDLETLKAEISRTYEYEYPTASGAFDEFAAILVPNIIKNAPTVIEAEGKDDG